MEIAQAVNAPTLGVAGSVPLDNVTDMAYMFQFAASFNGDLSSWNIGEETDTAYMFFGAAAYDGDKFQ